MIEFLLYSTKILVEIRSKRENIRLLFKPIRKKHLSEKIMSLNNFVILN